MLQFLNLMDKWTSYLENRGQIDEIYTDFEKAFDKVPHKRLLSKLKSYGVHDDTMKWIKGFLCHRKHRVRINGKFSSWEAVLSGIPQESVLGPLLFVIFINDLPSICEGSCGDCDGKCELYLFADDAKIFKYVKTQNDQTALHMCCNELYKWTNKWFMRLNVGK
jgi:ribonuclease P/MRP protein subunit RPP40